MGVVNEHLKYFSFVAGTLMSLSILTIKEKFSLTLLHVVIICLNLLYFSNQLCKHICPRMLMTVFYL